MSGDQKREPNRINTNFPSDSEVSVLLVFISLRSRNKPNLEVSESPSLSIEREG